MSLETVFVFGSSRPRGNTRLLVEHVNHAQAAPIVDLGVVESLVSFRKIVFATPVYSYAMSAQMKTFLDRLTDLITIRNDLGRALAKLDCAVMASGTDTEPPASFFKPFHRTAQYFEMRYLGSFYGYFEAELKISEKAVEGARRFAQLVFGKDS